MRVKFLIARCVFIFMLHHCSILLNAKGNMFDLRGTMSLHQWIMFDLRWIML